MNDNEQREIIAANLRNRIAKSNKEQKQIAKELGVAYSTFNTWTRAKSMPNANMLHKLADYFMCQVSDITDDKENDPKYKYNTHDVDLLLKVNSDDGIKEILNEYFSESPDNRERIKSVFHAMLKKD